MKRLITACLLLAVCSVAPRASSAAGEWKPVEGNIVTRWAKDVSPEKALPEYPRPQMERKEWRNLNGLWDYALTDAAASDPPASFGDRILVPFAYESALSGLKKASIPDQRLWYRRHFTVPAGWRDQHVLLHFGAVNYDSSVFLNGKPVGTHRGGYDAFEYDITDALKPGTNELIVSAWNPLWSDDERGQVLGKQRLHPGGIMYTACTGIWQTVWIEPVHSAHINSFVSTPDVDASVLKLTISTNPGEAGIKVTAVATDSGAVVAKGEGEPGQEINLAIKNPHLWSPIDPHLYGLKIMLTQSGSAVDTVESYFAMRKVSLGKDEQGRMRIMLNNKFVFQVGLLDQGYWPDGIYTAPTDAALKYDIEVSKRLGYNLLRKHAKVEPDRWYYWTDKLGILVWQDMPQAFAGRNGALTDEAKQQFLTELNALITNHYNHPSIVSWTAFNEGWGEHDVAQIVARIKELDPTRTVDDASGWNDEHVGDIADTHAYPGPRSGLPEAARAAVDGEFGGVTMRVPGHMWTTDLFGYGNVLNNTWLVTKRYQELLKAGYGLRDTRGTSALVYTQLTDVEQESNGILTYDRAIIKPNIAITTAANEGRFLPLPPNPDPQFIPTSEAEPQSWSYTFDRPAGGWELSTFDAGSWKIGQAGFGKGYPGVHTAWGTDDIWLRREVTIAGAIPDKLDVLTLHDEDVEVYFNGVLAASARSYNGSYVRLPVSAAARAALKPGKNLIAVHCHQTVGGQFIDVGVVKAQ